MASLRTLLGVAHDTIERWLSILEGMYVCFRVLPYGSSRIRAVRKERKLYLFDWSQVPDAGARFENLVAAQLLKYCHFMEDTEGRKPRGTLFPDAERHPAVLSGAPGGA